MRSLGVPAQAPPPWSGVSFTFVARRYAPAAARVPRSTRPRETPFYRVRTNFTASATTYPFAPVAQMVMLPFPVAYPALNG